MQTGEPAFRLPRAGFGCLNRIAWSGAAIRGADRLIRRLPPPA
jgi:hypothetical protein